MQNQSLFSAFTLSTRTQDTDGTCSSWP